MHLPLCLSLSHTLSLSVSVSVCLSLSISLFLSLPPTRFPVLSPLSQFHSLPRMCPHQSHLHTISGLSGLASRHGYHCSRCAQRKWPPILLPTWDPLKPQPPQSLILPSLEPQALQKSPLQGGVCVDTPPKCAQSQGEVGQAGERRPGGPGGTFLSVGR